MSAIVTTLPEFNPANWDAQVGAEIKRRLVGRGTQEQIAAALGIGQPEVSKRLNGRISWKGRELATIADLLGVTMDELCGRADGNRPAGGSNRPGPVYLLPHLDSNQEPIG